MSAFKTVGDKLTGKAGAIFKLIFGGFGSNQQNNSENSNNLTGSTGQAGFGSVGTSSVTATSGNMVNGFPYYMQSDSQWGAHPYGSHGTLSTSACGPTSMAMVMKSYGENVTPVDTADWSAAHGYRASSGTSWDYFKAIGNSVGLDVKQFDPDVARVKQDLQNGIPVIGSMRPGNFTKNGHFVVFTGMDSRGNIYVNDPSSSVRTGHSWLSEQSLSQGKQFWEISKNGQGSLGKLTETDPSTEGAAGGSSGLPLFYNFTGGASKITAYDINKAKKSQNTTWFNKNKPVTSTSAGDFKRMQYNNSYQRINGISDLNKAYYSSEKARKQALQSSTGYLRLMERDAAEREKARNSSAGNFKMMEYASLNDKDAVIRGIGDLRRDEYENGGLAEGKAVAASIRASRSSSSGSSYSSGSGYSSGSSYAGSAPIATAPGGVDATTLNTITEYLKIIAENSKYEASLPTIVDLIGKLAGITATVNSNTASITNQDTVNNINQDLSSVMQKLETMASTL